MVFGQAIHVWSELDGQFIENDVYIVVSELLLVSQEELAARLQRLIDDSVFLDLDVGLRDDSVLDHFASQLQILLGGLLGDFKQFFLVVLKVEVQKLLLLLLALLLFERHPLVELGSPQPG